MWVASLLRGLAEHPAPERTLQGPGCPTLPLQRPSAPVGAWEGAAATCTLPAAGPGGQMHVLWSCHECALCVWPWRAGRAGEARRKDSQIPPRTSFLGGLPLSRRVRSLFASPVSGRASSGRKFSPLSDHIPRVLPTQLFPEATGGRRLEHNLCP